MNHLELVTECEVCGGQHYQARPEGLARTGDLVLCPGSGGSRISLDPDRKLFIKARFGELHTVQDVLDALEET